MDDWGEWGGCEEGRVAADDGDGVSAGEFAYDAE